MAVTVHVQCRNITFDGVTILIPVSLRLAGQADDVGHDFSGLAANIANADAILPYIKNQVVNFIQSHYGVPVPLNEVAVTGAPQ